MRAGGDPYELLALRRVHLAFALINLPAITVGPICIMTDVIQQGGVEKFLARGGEFISEHRRDRKSSAA